MMDLTFKRESGENPEQPALLCDGRSSHKPPGQPGKAGLEDEIKSGDLLYIGDSFRWGKGSVYAAFFLPFFIT